MWMNGDSPVGGVMALPEEAKQAGAPPHWIAYITTPDVDATANKIKELGVVPLIADNTLIRGDIAQELRKFGRAGVPMVLVYSGDREQPPTVLPTVLTPAIVLDALDEAAEVKNAAK